MRTNDEWSSHEVLTRAVAYLQRVRDKLLADGHESVRVQELNRHTSGGTIQCSPILYYDGKRLMYAREMQKRIGPYQHELQGRVSLILDIPKDVGDKKTFSESKSGLKMPWDKIASWVDEVVSERAYINERNKAVWNARDEAARRLDELLPEYIGKRILPGASYCYISVDAFVTRDNTAAYTYKINLTIPGEALEDVVFVLRKALAPYAKEASDGQADG